MRPLWNVTIVLLAAGPAVPAGRRRVRRGRPIREVRQIDRVHRDTDEGGGTSDGLRVALSMSRSGYVITNYHVG